MKRSLILISLFLSFILNISYVIYAKSDKELDYIKRGIVSIKTNASIKPYGEIFERNEGIGCIIDKEKGIILTTKYIADPLALANYEITFYNGAHTTAKLLYYDLWLDFAFLKVEPASLPRNVTQFDFSNIEPSLNQQVSIVGKNENKQINVVAGNIINLHEICGSMPQQAMLVTLTNKAIFDGAPVLDKKNKLISICIHTNDNLSKVLDSKYIRYAFTSMVKGTEPVRYHAGIIASLYSLNDAVKYRNFPSLMLPQYLKEFPNSMSNSIQVDHTLKNSPASLNLIAGDILWAVDGIQIGPNLSTLDMRMNTTVKDSIILTICRNGEWKDLEVQLYNMEDRKIQKMVQFAGTLFFETDDVFSDKTGIPTGKVTFFRSEANTTFNKLVSISRDNTLYFLLHLISIDNIVVDNLNMLIAIVPLLIEKKKFTIDYTNMLIYKHGFSEVFGESFSQKNQFKDDITYDINSASPLIITFDKKNMQWISSEFTSLKVAAL
jgi:S1-C subfamily serine protease